MSAASRNWVNDGRSRRRVVLIDFNPHIVTMTDKDALLQQLALFPAHTVSVPPGFHYEDNFLSIEEEKRLVCWIETLPLTPFEFHGHLGNRRITSFGFSYDYTRQAVDAAAPIPARLGPIITRAARWSGHSAGEIGQVLISEYAPGAPIGWHTDKPQFGEVLGISLLAPARFRLRRAANDRWERKTITLAPRSIYLLSGEVRNAWQHSIPPMTALRYSITLRTLADNFSRRRAAQKNAA